MKGSCNVTYLGWPMRLSISFIHRLSFFMYEIFKKIVFQTVSIRLFCGKLRSWCPKSLAICQYGMPICYFRPPEQRYFCKFIVICCIHHLSTLKSSAFSGHSDDNKELYFTLALEYSGCKRTTKIDQYRLFLPSIRLWY